MAHFSFFTRDNAELPQPGGLKEISLGLRSPRRHPRSRLQSTWHPEAVPAGAPPHLGDERMSLTGWPALILALMLSGLCLTPLSAATADGPLVWNALTNEVTAKAGAV